MRSVGRTDTLDLTGSPSGVSMPADQLLSCSLQAVVTGTAAGTLKFQYSNDEPTTGTQTDPTTWSDIPSASVAVTNSGTYVIAKLDLCYRFIRVTYARTSSTGTPIAVCKTAAFGF